MDTVNMRTAINQAQQHERRTRELAQLLQRRLHRLHRSVTVTDIDPVPMLLEFVNRFIKRTPDLLDTIYSLNRNTSREDLAEALINTCVEFFVAPPQLLQGRHGLNGAMCRAFSCQRLIEDINDCCLISSGEALVALDITRSNLVIHHLVGEPYANLLEEQVQGLCQNLLPLVPCRSTLSTGAPAHTLGEGRHQAACMDDELTGQLFASNVASLSIH